MNKKFELSAARFSSEEHSKKTCIHRPWSHIQHRVGVSLALIARSQRMRQGTHHFWTAGGSRRTGRKPTYQRRNIPNRHIEPEDRLRPGIMTAWGYTAHHQAVYLSLNLDALTVFRRGLTKVCIRKLFQTTHKWPSSFKPFPPHVLFNKHAILKCFCYFKKQNHQNHLKSTIYPFSKNTAMEL